MTTTNNLHYLIKTTTSLAFLIAIGSASPQNLIVTSDARKIALTPNPARVTFVPSKANTAEGAAKDAVLSAATGQAIATAARFIPIPFAAPTVGMVLNRLHPKSARSGSASPSCRVFPRKRPFRTEHSAQTVGERSSRGNTDSLAHHAIGQRLDEDSPEFPSER
jgi:hypothetical protein